MATFPRLPAKLDRVAWPGAGWRLALTFAAGDPAAPVDLTGAAARFLARTAGGETRVDVSDGTGHVTLGGAAGTVVVALGPDDLPPAGTDTPYVLSLTAPGGVVVPILQGLLRVTAGPPAGGAA